MKRPVPPPPIVWSGRVAPPPAAIQSKAGPGIGPPPTRWPGKGVPPVLQQKPWAVAPPAPARPDRPQIAMQMKPRSVAPPPGRQRCCMAAVLQRAAIIEEAYPLDESAASLRVDTEKLLEIGKWNGKGMAKPRGGVQEVQAMTLGGVTYYSTNDVVLDAVTSRVAVFSDLTSVPAQYQKNLGRFDVLRTFARDMTGARWIRGDYHAEQNLLLYLARKIKNGDVPGGTVRIFGTKPPCNICQQVMETFEVALSVADLGIKVLYDYNAGDQSVTRSGAGVLSLAGLKSSSESKTKFDKFVDAYEWQISARPGLRA